MNILVIGCGTIGSVIVNELVKLHQIKKIYIYDKVFEKSIEVCKCSSKCKIIDKFYIPKDIKFVVECASQKAVKEYSSAILKKGKDLMIMSIGALLNKKFYQKITKLAKINSTKIYLPSGAVIGIDGIKAANLEKIYSVELITSKPPQSFNLKNIKQKKVLFIGSAKDAVKKYPQNINVSAVIALAGIGSEKTKVRIICDPKLGVNTHKIIVKGTFGKFITETYNFPMPTNPKTSYLAALSAVACIRKLFDTVQIGT